MTWVGEEVCDGFVIGGGKTLVMRQGTLAAEAQMPFWLQMVGNGLMTTWAAHLGAVLTNATWPAITCINLFSHHLLKKPIEVVGGYHRVPDGPGLGVEVDEEAVERFRVPDDAIAPFRKEGKPYDRPKPRLLNTVVYPDGSCVHMAYTVQGYGYFGSGHGPAQVPGARLEITPDDGSKTWAELFARAEKQPVRDRWRG